jgi:chaperone LolA
MRKFSPICFFLLIAFAEGHLEAAKDPSAKEIIRRVQQKIERIGLIEAEFVQTFYWSLAAAEEEFHGKIYIGKNDEFRIETPEQVIVSDGESVWTWSMTNRQVIIDYMDQSQESFLPRHLFANYSKDYKVTLNGTERLGEWNCYHLILESKSPDVFLQKIEVWIDPTEWLTRKLTYLDANENLTAFEIKKIQLKAKADGSLFNFVPDDSVEVVDLR